MRHINPRGDHHPDARSGYALIPAGRVAGILFRREHDHILTGPDVVCRAAREFFIPLDTGNGTMLAGTAGIIDQRTLFSVGSHARQFVPSNRRPTDRMAGGTRRICLVQFYSGIPASLRRPSPDVRFSPLLPWLTSNDNRFSRH